LQPNYLPMENTVLHKANERGHANHGWLNAYHSFSFANFYNPEKVHFGALRVLNDDTVAAGMGFGTHPHNDMEIITIPLEGELEHKDSMGNTAVIKSGEVQVMSAGSGITHSEYNKNKEKELKLLQIWIIPNKRGVTPRYDEMQLEEADSKNKFQQIVSPSSDDEGVWIHQDAWLHLGNFNAGKTVSYDIKQDGNGLYVFVIEGEVVVNGQVLHKRDALGIWETDTVNFTINKEAKILLLDVPMQF
jgi:quercetin 2,3-dioxygenase